MSVGFRIVPFKPVSGLLFQISFDIVSDSFLKSDVIGDLSNTKGADRAAREAGAYKFDL